MKRLAHTTLPLDKKGERLTVKIQPVFMRVISPKFRAVGLLKLVCFPLLFDMMHTAEWDSLEMQHRFTLPAIPHAHCADMRRSDDPDAMTIPDKAGLSPDKIEVVEGLR